VKLTTNTQVSIDGVMQANGGRHEILDPGMERGGWARPLFDSEAMAFVDEFYQRADAFLFGRRTYDLFAGYWGVRDDLENPIVGALNTKPKYVASNTLTEADWADTTVLSGDVAVAIRELKAKPGGELQVHGSGLLTRWLLENDLVDEMNLLVCPVIVGQDMRLFPDSGRAVRDSGLLDEFVARAGADPDTMTLHELPYREAKRYLAEHAPGVDGDATAASDAPPPPFVYAKSDFFRQLLPESTIRALVEHFLASRAAGQAREPTSHPGAARTTASTRRRPHSLIARSLFLLKHAVIVPADAADADRDRGRRWLGRSWERVRASAAGGVFPNFPDPDLAESARAYHGANSERLIHVKARDDPGNFFRFHQPL
jgi:dihydrofolate reductase